MIKDIIRKSEDYLSSINKIPDILDSINKQQQILEAKKLTLTESIKDLDIACSYYKKGIDYLYDKTIRDLENQLTSLMQEVFTGCEYGVHFEIEDLRGVKNLIIELFDERYKGSPDDLGGSLETVVGYLFHMMYLIKMGKPRILFMDEMFKDVNTEYSINLVDLINRLTKETNSINVLITHADDLECVVENVYSVKGGNYELHTSQI